MSIEDLVSSGIEQKTAYHTDYSVIDQIITKYFDLPQYRYEMMPLEEVGSSQYAACWDTTVEPELPDSYDQKYIDAVKNKKPIPYGTGVILNYLCYHGVIPAGPYIIDVSW